VAVRAVRRDANQDIKELAKEKLISTDDEKRGETDIQKLTDQYIGRIDEMSAAKEKELMSL
jgi:ribosome recycling factor